MSLQQIEIEELVPDNVRINMVEKDHMDGNVSEKEVEIISNIVAHFKPKTIFEFGTFDGRTTINMAINVPSDTKIYTLNLPASQAHTTKYPLASPGQYSDMTYINKEETGKRYKGKEGSEKIIQLFGDSATFDYAPYANSMDLIFVDGSHARQYTENDTRASLLMLRLGGIILWHDYASVWPYVTAVLDEYALAGSDIKHIAGTTLAFLKTS